MYEIINTFQILGVLVGFLTLFTIARKKASEIQKVLLIACCCAFVSILAYTLEINARSLDAMVMAIKFGYVGKCYVLLFFLMFMAAYCNISIPKMIFRFFIIFNTIMLMLIITCDRHTLYYKNLHISYDGFFPHAEFEPGICYWMLMTVMVGLIVWYIIICIMEVRKRKGIERKRLMLLSFSGLIPGYMLILYLDGVMNIFDPVPLGIVLSCTLLTLNVLKYGLLDTMQLAKEKVIENTKDGLVIVDPNYNLLYANEMAISLFPDMNNMRSGQKRIQGIFEGDTRESVIEIGGRNYEIRVSQIEDDNYSDTVRGYLAWIFDMNFVNRYTEEMIRLKQEAEKANLAKTTFLAHMSHEIRTPMNAIIGFSDLCLNNKDGKEQREYVQNIRESAGTLMALINEVLDISKIESGKMILTDVNYSMKDLMGEVIAPIIPQVNAKGLSFRYLLEKNVPALLRGDKKRIRQIMSNLLSNALKYTKEGTILFKVKEIRRQNGKIMLEIAVKDTGIGIKEEDKERIFSKFEQFDAEKNYAVEGSGLGLSIVKSLVEMMNGSVEASSVYGEGSLFKARMWQKISDDSPGGEYRGSNCDEIGYTLEQLKNATRKRIKKQERRQICFPGTKVLVVDDNRVNLKVASGLLKLYGICADLVESGRECLKAVKEREYDMIFLDQMMPEMDGTKVLRCLRELEKGAKRTPVIALTANALVGVKEEMLEEGFDDFLGKPMDLTELENVLMRFMKDRMAEGAAKDEEAETLKEEFSVYRPLMEKGVDVEAGIELCGGQESYREVLEAFSGNAIEQQKNLSIALKKNDYERYTILAHALKSTAASIGALELSELAKAHETAGGNRDAAYINEDFVHLLEVYEEIVKAIGSEDEKK